MKPWKAAVRKRKHQTIREARGCLGKVRYSTRAAAEIECDRLALITPRDAEKRPNVYECHFCGRFHVGNAAVREAVA